MTKKRLDTYNIPTINMDPSGYVNFSQKRKRKDMIILLGVEAEQTSWDDYKQDEHLQYRNRQSNTNLWTDGGGCCNKTKRRFMNHDRSKPQTVHRSAPEAQNLIRPKLNYSTGDIIEERKDKTNPESGEKKSNSAQD